jgi:hypothetical protein
MSLSAKRPSKGEQAKEKLMNDVKAGESKARLNADIEKSLYRKIKMRCLEEDRSISEITRQLWIEYLSI